MRNHMPDLTTEYMALRLRSPVLVAASTLSGHLVCIRQAEAAGAGGNETLKISFGTHEIVVSGRTLTEITSALQGSLGMLVL
jgi:hypothetical protein